MTRLNLLTQIAESATELSQSLEKLSTDYCEERFSGISEAESFDGKLLLIDEIIDEIDKLSSMAREIERAFKFV